MTRKQLTPFHVTELGPCPIPRKFPKRVTYAPASPPTLSPPEFGPLSRSVKKRRGGGVCASTIDALNDAQIASNVMKHQRICITCVPPPEKVELIRFVLTPWGLLVTPTSTVGASHRR